ncbi:hypothetical protein GLW08_21285 [Pontibacillus yanchengensis]|uniref:Uncharacterized protein n=2 Tax=Pontibacillus yanchengensis TaxID=462910 RepID=A0ACC7VM32_9BACI|nr:hypothetical protein [Pontibacillus yanchengensis]MYL35418.1 hypothetical protein [Pontibacillus yanchengensis]MYL55837.1 hypothetical protein [Pontibacillus yanchengensis]
MYYSLDDVAHRLGKSMRQIRYMIKQGTAKPINPKTYRSDGGYMFDQDEVNRLEHLFETDKLSLNEAAELIGITPQYLSSLAVEGTIISELKKIGKRTYRLFSKEDCHSLKEELSNNHSTKRHTQFGDKLTLYNDGIRLFMLSNYKHEQVRVVRVEPLTLLKENGEVISADSTDTTSDAWPERSYVRKKGFVEFRISIPRHIEHQTYNTLYKMIGELGTKNIQIYETSMGDYFVRCRQGNFFGNQEDFELLKMHIRAGKIRMEGHRIYLDTNYVSKTINIPDQLFDKLSSNAETEDVSVEEKIISLIEENL